MIAVGLLRVPSAIQLLPMLLPKLLLLLRRLRLWPMRERLRCVLLLHVLGLRDVTGACAAAVRGAVPDRRLHALMIHLLLRCVSRLHPQSAILRVGRGKPVRRRSRS